MKESKFYWTFTKIRLFDCWGMLQILKWEVIELLFLLHYLPTQMNVFFFFSREANKGFRVLRNEKMQYYLLLLSSSRDSPVLPVRNPSKKNQNSNSLSQSLSCSAQRDLLVLNLLCQNGWGWCLFCYFAHLRGWGYHCWMGCRIGPCLYDIWAQRPYYTNFFLKVLIVQSSPMIIKIGILPLNHWEVS